MGCVQLGERKNGLDKTIKISKKSFKTRQASKDQTETANDLPAHYAELRSSKTSSLDFFARLGTSFGGTQEREILALSRR